MEGIRLPLDKRPRRPKPTITPLQSSSLVQLVDDLCRCVDGPQSQ